MCQLGDGSTVLFWVDLEQARRAGSYIKSITIGGKEKGERECRTEGLGNVGSSGHMSTHATPIG